MVKIETAARVAPGGGFKVSFSAPGSGMRGYSRITDDLEAALTLVRHFYARAHDRENCQFCREGREADLRQHDADLAAANPAGRINLGGRRGIPGIATEENTVKVRKKRNRQ
jgi:hypothetical protein